MRSATLPSPNWRIYFPKRQRIAKTMGYSRETGIGEIISCGLPTAATTPNIAQRCSYAHTKFAQQIQFTVGHLADFDSAYFSESESVKLVYITDIARFTRLETRLTQVQFADNIVVVDDAGWRPRLIVSRYQFRGCNPSFSRCVVFWESISSNLVTAKWHCAPPGHIYLISKKTCLALIL